ncbi:MAG: AzlD domain-containing protein, partial [Rhodoluna sp.]|nr:AzlD domain-containing protein [Rhodoluna sp.]
MNLTLAVLLASLAVYSWKFFGYLVPEKFLEKPAVSRVAGLLTVALLAALMATQTLTKNGEIQLDARIPSLVVAAILLRFKA